MIIYSGFNWGLTPIIPLQTTARTPLVIAYVLLMLPELVRRRRARKAGAGARIAVD